MRPEKSYTYTSRTADKFVVRLPDGMRELVASHAHDNHRSMNSEIVARLNESFFGADEESLQTTPTSRSDDIVQMLNIQPWNPRVGDLVKRRDTNRILGTITKFESGQLGVMATVSQFEGGLIRQAVGVLMPVDITQIIEESAGPIHRALERVTEGKNDGKY